MNTPFLNELKKLAKDNSSPAKGFATGAIAGIASTLATHPLEHTIYGENIPKKITIPFLKKKIRLDNIRSSPLKHLAFRMPKSILAMGAGYGVYELLRRSR